ncbi:MAG: hypothetical protein NTV48_01585 [Candidatus Vogelbacteria bacterium]|nr:hypothetical protein [Candidatus Vogelbacteria bacterium]
MITRSIQPKLRGQIEQIIGKKDNDSFANLLAVHLEEIYEESRNISASIEKILNKKITVHNLYSILVKIKVNGNHLKDHLIEMKKPNEKVLVELDKIIRTKTKSLKK